jgi:hypothetical protein
MIFHIFNHFLQATRFLFQTQITSIVTAHLAGITVFTGMLFLAARFFFRDIYLALKPGYFDKNHFNPRQPESVQCNPHKNRHRMNIPDATDFFR